MKDSLFDLASRNTSLVFVEEEKGQEHALKDMVIFNFESQQRKLAFLYLDNSLLSVQAYWSIMKSNSAAALLSQSLSTDLKMQLERLYHPAIIFDPTRMVIPSYTLSEDSQGGIFYSEGDTVSEIHPDIKLLLSTSGTTGSPKFVKLSERNLISNAQSIIDYLPINGNDVTPLNLPIFYSYGLSVLNTNALAGGKVVCVTSDVLKRDFWTSFQRYGFTSLAGVPYTYEMLDRIGIGKKALPSIKYITQAGGKLSEPLVMKFLDYSRIWNIPFFVMYGQTEATARMSYLPPDSLHSKVGSIGRPIRGGEFFLDNETGELCYSGPNVFGGYVSSPADLASFEKPAFLRTGDIGRIDRDGYYYIVGRIKRFIKLFGNRVNMDEVEDMCSRAFKTSIKCAGLNDEKLLVFVPQIVEAKTVSEFISRELKIHITGVKSINVSDWPQTANGKTDYNKLLEIYGPS